MSVSQHPYYPQELDLPHYVPNTLSLLNLLSGFGGVMSILWISTWFLGGASPYVRASATSERFILMWFVMCGCLHTTFEAYFAWNYKTLAGDRTVFGQLWKEYARGDSRYLIGDTLVLALERITIFIIGPLSFLTAHAIFSNLPTRHLLQFTTSLSHFFSCTLYLLVDVIEGSRHSRPESLYYWVYFVGFNSPWIVIPIALIVQSWGFLYLAVIRQSGELKDKQK
ncbi:Emopamil binding protein-domain-containing protein [Jimgerdemannia flammicorona]|uniref:Emopamil binding protein-domain-containing protein n=1 Tax=Jimgerdemannia flammicorona TaxID=994334 RepID=A0A433Q323_9FUNG|nr:Emopamil binding protein-domain-containing protein [Jimgerdemannia flammicorona]